MMALTNKIVLVNLVLCFLIVSLNAQSKEKKDSFKSVQDIEAFFVKTRGPLRKTDLNNLVLPLEVKFKLNSAKLTERAKEQLDNLGIVLQKKENNNLKLELAGHTCDLGSSDYNMMLSQKRVSSAFDYLNIKYNIPSSKLSTKAYGESLPLIPNAHNEEQRAINRRVVIYLPENRSLIEKLLKERSIVPGLKLAIFHYTENNNVEMVKYDGTSKLKSGDKYRIYLNPFTLKYLYVYQKDAHGNGQWLFPAQNNPAKNPLKPGEYYLPNRSEVFVLDKNTGLETISIVATDQPVKKLDDIISGHSSQDYADAVAQIIKTRGLKITRIGPPPQGSETKSGKIVVSRLTDTEDTTQKKDYDIDVSNIMTEFGEFYMEIQFDHQ